MKVFQSRSQNSFRAVVGLQGIREDQLAAGPEHPVDLGEHAVATLRMQDRILGPGQLEMRILGQDGLETAGDDLDATGKFDPLVHLPMAHVLGLAEIRGQDPASEAAGE